MAKIQDTTLLSNEAKIGQLTSQLAEKEGEIKKLQALLEARVDQSPQFQNLKKMLQMKEKRIEELED